MVGIEALLSYMFTVFIGLSLIIYPLYALYMILAMIFGRKHKIEVYQNDESLKNFYPSLSIITATYNEIANISRKIDEMLHLNYPSEKIEWIIIDDNSSDGTIETIKKRIHELPFDVKFIIREGKSGLSTALNLAYSIAKNEIIIKSDCDIILLEDTLENLVKPFADPKVGAVCGESKVLNNVEFEESYRNLRRRVRNMESNITSTYMFDTLSAYRRSLFTGIDPKSAADDAELALKIIKKGYKAINNPLAVFGEICPTSFEERRKQRDRRAEGHIKLAIKNIDMLFRPKYGLFGLFIFPFNFYSLVVSPILTFLWLLLGVILGGYIISVNIWLVPFLIFMTALAHSLHVLDKFLVFLDAQWSLLVAIIRIIKNKDPTYIWK